MIRPKRWHFLLLIPVLFFVFRWSSPFDPSSEGLDQKARDRPRHEDEDEEDEGPSSLLHQVQPKYLLPHLLFGPSNQFHGLKEAAMMAKILGRTLVLTDITTHYSAGIGNLGKGQYRFDEVFDPEQVAAYVNVIGLEEFKALCNSTLDLYVMTRDGRCTRSLVNMADRIGVEAKRSVALASLGSWKKPKKGNAVLGTRRELIKLLGGLEEPYLGVGCTYGLLVETHGNIHENLFLKRSLRVAWAFRFAQPFREAVGRLKLFHGQPYGAIHLRIDERENDCEALVPQGKEGQIMCFGAQQYYHLDIPCLATHLRRQMKQHGLRGFYVSERGNFTTLTPRLRALGLPVLSQAEVASTALGPGGEALREFTWSVMEQQISIEAELFLGTRTSSWTQFIVYSRMAGRKGALAKGEHEVTGQDQEAMEREVVALRKKGMEEGEGRFITDLRCATKIKASRKGLDPARKL